MSKGTETFVHLQLFPVSPTSFGVSVISEYAPREESLLFPVAPIHKNIGVGANCVPKYL